MEGGTEEPRPTARPGQGHRSVQRAATVEKKGASTYLVRGVFHLQPGEERDVLRDGQQLGNLIFLEEKARISTDALQEA